MLGRDAGSTPASEARAFTIVPARDNTHQATTRVRAFITSPPLQAVIRRVSRVSGRAEAVQVLFEVRAAVAIPVAIAVGRISGVQTVAPLPTVGHPIAIGVDRGRTARERRPAADLVLRVDHPVAPVADAG